jgi:hypothetical protein
MTLFTVHVELGPETRALVERITAQPTIRIQLGPLELGPKTLEAIGNLSLMPSKREGDEGLLRKAASVARGT